jgi:hypothetical protein
MMQNGSKGFGEKRETIFIAVKITSVQAMKRQRMLRWRRKNERLKEKRSRLMLELETIRERVC